MVVSEKKIKGAWTDAWWRHDMYIVCAVVTEK